jgi:hypothetical protein
MKRRAVVLTDELSADRVSVTLAAPIGADDVIDALTPWFPDAPANVMAAIAILGAEIAAGSYRGDAAEKYLGVSVTTIM